MVNLLLIGVQMITFLIINLHQGFVNRVGAELTLRPATLESYALDAINLKSCTIKTIQKI
jgi:hypothetical protein